MPLEYSPPKYVTIVNALQARIEDGTYVPGVMLPSETALMGEFTTSRPTVVRALEILRQHGWIETQQGKGRFVRSRPAEARTMPSHAAALLTNEVEGRVRVVDVAEVPAPPRAAAVLELDAGAPIVVRRRLVSADDIGPIELGTAYVPVGLAAGTAVSSSAPLADGLLEHLATRKGIHFDRATERISARLATKEEAVLLEIGARDCVLTALVAVYAGGDRPAFALDIVVPPTRHEFEDSFTLV